MKTDAQLSESIDRFQRVFWRKESGGRPPVAVVNPDMWLPAKYLRRPFPRPTAGPHDAENCTRFRKRTPSWVAGIWPGPVDFSIFAPP